MTGNELREAMAAQDISVMELAYRSGYTVTRIYQVLKLGDAPLPKRTAAILQAALQSLARKKKVS